MRKLIIALLSFSLYTQSFAQISNYEFKFISWGSSPEQVKEKEKGRFISEFENTLRYERKMYQKDATITYNFESSKLNYINVLFDSMPEDHIENFDVFNVLSIKISQNHGVPYSNVQEKLAEVNNDTASLMQALLQGEIELFYDYYVGYSRFSLVLQAVPNQNKLLTYIGVEPRKTISNEKPQVTSPSVSTNTKSSQTESLYEIDYYTLMESGIAMESAGKNLNTALALNLSAIGVLTIGAAIGSGPLVLVGVLMPVGALVAQFSGYSKIKRSGFLLKNSIRRKKIKK